MNCYECPLGSGACRISEPPKLLSAMAEMEGKERKDASTTTLPDELVERVIAMMPFPYIFKARCLSKLWLARFASIASLNNDETKKRLAISFQKQVGERSKHWGTFYPVCIDQTQSIAYNRAPHRWQRMPSLSYLPWTMVNSSQVQIRGALLLAPSWPIVNRLNSIRGPRGYNQLPAERKDLFVANILTGSWKQLPPRPKVAQRKEYGETHLGKDYGETLVTDASSGTYMVIAFGRDFDGYFAQIYYSKSAAWTTTKLGGVSDYLYLLRSAAYLNGVLYMLAGYNRDSLLAFDIEAGTWEKLRLPATDLTNEEKSVKTLVVCKSDLMVVMGFGLAPREDFHVLKLDLGTLRLSKVARRPPVALALSLGRFNFFKAQLGQEPVSDGRCIFLGMDKFEGTMVEYDVHENEWSCSNFPTTNPSKRYDWVASCLQPGSNPFMEV